MKRHYNLYHEIYSWKNLLYAWKRARKGKRLHISASLFECHLDEELTQLRASLLDESYISAGYTSFTVHEPKRRKISAAPFRDRVVHHALCNILVPIFERKFIYDSYANRVGKGTHAALDRCTYFMRRYPYVLPCDIQQFFPAIDHEILKSRLAAVIGDTQVLRLCGKIIDSGKGILDSEYRPRFFPGDDLFASLRPRGLPIGNLTSQFWANVYLNPLDQFIKRNLKCTAYVRYVDDFLLFANDLPTLNHWKVAIIDFLVHLRLTIHENRSHAQEINNGIPFLGFTIFPEHRRLRRSKGISYRRHLGTLYRNYRSQRASRKDMDVSVRAWIGHAQHGDTWGLRTRMFEKIIL
jgi:retron-type reverse transcriptase